MRFRQSLKLASSWLAEVERAGAAVASFIVFAMMCMVFTDVIGRKLIPANLPQEAESSLREVDASVRALAAAVDAIPMQVPELQSFSRRCAELRADLELLEGLARHASQGSRLGAGRRAPRLAAVSGSG